MKKKIFGLFIRLIMLAFIGFAIFTPNEPKNAPKRAKTALEETPEITYNTYYLISWNSPNGTFIPDSLGWPVTYKLDSNYWNWNKLQNNASDTLMISTTDKRLIYINDFIANYGEFDINLSISSQLIVPYVSIINEKQEVENFNILMSLNTFLNNTSYRYLSIINNYQALSTTIIYSSLNVGNNTENIIIEWNQPSLISVQDTISVPVGNNTNLYNGFLQPISIQINNKKALLNEYNKGYEKGVFDGEKIGFENAKNQITGLVWVEETLKVTQRFLDIRFFPNITLGHLVGGILIVELIIWFIRWWR